MKLEPGLWACGSNGRGQLGLGHEEDTNKWTRVPLSFSDIVDLSGGGNHTVLVTSSGNAYGTGLGFGDQFTQIHPKDHTVKIRFTHCCSGWDFSVLGDAAGRLWTLAGGQLTQEARIPARPILKLAAGLKHVLVLCEDGEVWAMDKVGAVSPQDGSYGEPRRIFTTGTDIACGRNFSLIVSDDGTLIPIGRRIPRLEMLGPAVGVWAGWSFAAARTSSGRLVMAGNDSHGQLNGDGSSPRLYASGSEHSVAATEDTVITWGWGEHGNCPPPWLVPEARRVWAGCATSFVLA